MKNHEHVSLFHGARPKFPLEQCHDRARIELAVTGRSEHLHFVGHSGFVIYSQAVNTLALITEMLRFDWILRIGSSKRVLFVLRRDPNYVGGKARRQDREKQQGEQNSKGSFHTLGESKHARQSDVSPAIQKSN